MKNISYITFLFVVFTTRTLFSQWHEDFADGNLSANPSWLGELVDFNIDNEKLHLDVDDEGNSLLYTQYSIQNSQNYEWTMFVDIDFSPSQNNRLHLYLYSPDSLFTDDENVNNYPKYYLNIGETGANDAIELVKVLSPQSEPIIICRGQEGYNSSAFEKSYKIRYIAGTWEIHSANFGSPYFELEASGEDAFIHELDGFFGLDLLYTTSNTDAFHFDDLGFSLFSPDTIEPELESFTILNEDQLQLNFSEALDSSALQNENYSLSNLQNQVNSAAFVSSLQDQIILTFDTIFPFWTLFYLEIEFINDLYENSTSNIEVQLVYSPIYQASSGDLQFSELMVDPSPTVGLPDVEYIELYNHSDSILDIDSYLFLNSGNATLLPSYILKPDSFVLLSKAVNAIYLSNFGPVIALDSWSALVNSGDSLVLKNKDGFEVDHVYYEDYWYANSLKKEGGWSLERIDFDSHCYSSINWSASQFVSGGTPGSTNSMEGFEIENPIFLKQLYLLDSTYLKIEIEGELEANSIETIGITSNPSFNIDWSQSIVENAAFILKCSPYFEKGTHYRLESLELYNCKSELYDLGPTVFGIIEEAIVNDVVINEVLFNPFSGANDFIELINRSSKFINLQAWSVNEMDDGLIVEDAKLSEDVLIINPNEIIAFSNNIEELAQLYIKHDKRQFIQVNDLPNFPDDEAKITLLNEYFQEIDQLSYSSEMHFSLLEDQDGVSLERIHPDRNSASKSTWISASEHSGFASPGEQNSHYWDAYFQHGKMLVEPPLFTPNNDGLEDALIISYELDEGGWYLKINIYNDDGILVKKLIDSEWVSSKGSFYWDGLNENEVLEDIGIYIVYFEAINAKGEKSIFKKPCVLGKTL